MTKERLAEAMFFRGLMDISGKRRSKRASSWDRSGGNEDRISVGPSEKVVLAEVAGPGCVKRTYATVFCVDRLWPRKLVLRMYWDDETDPSVEVPFGDFFGVSNCIHRFFGAALLAVSPGAYKIGPIGYNSFFPMPFSRGMRIELSNDGDVAVSDLWYQIDYDEWDEGDDALGRFHAQWRRENRTEAVPQPPGRWTGRNLDGADNYVILDAKGRGNFAGFMLSVDNVTGGWWGEGDDMIFIDGEKWPPSLHGTGTEEIFGGGACPDHEFAGLYAGFHLVSNADWSGKNGMYRFYVVDPIHFARDIRVTIERGHNNNLANDYSSVAYWYQAEPHRKSPPLLPVVDRLPIMPDTYRRIEAKDREAMRLMSRAVSSAGEIEESKLYEYFAQECQLREAINRAFADQRYEDAGGLADKLVSRLGERFGL